MKEGREGKIYNKVTQGETERISKRSGREVCESKEMKEGDAICIYIKKKKKNTHTQRNDSSKSRKTRKWYQSRSTMQRTT